MIKRTLYIIVWWSLCLSPMFFTPIKFLDIALGWGTLSAVVGGVLGKWLSERGYFNK